METQLEQDLCYNALTVALWLIPISMVIMPELFIVSLCITFIVWPLGELYKKRNNHES